MSEALIYVLDHNGVQAFDSAVDWKVAARTEFSKGNTVVDREGRFIEYPAFAMPLCNMPLDERFLVKWPGLRDRNPLPTITHSKPRPYDQSNEDDTWWGRFKNRG